ncbi:MAG: DUF1016 family protein [Candidatus Micrarchaeota archaeon]|nr:DUF1016 family protein [Candidatus Micrarchaeota archaeon]
MENQNNWTSILNKFVLQATTSDLKTSMYPKEWNGLKMRVSFGMGAPARIPWIAFTAPDMQVSKGFYPCYLYYKEFDTLILAYGVSETEEFGKSWPTEITTSTQTIATHFNREVARYGDSFVFKAYKIKSDKEKINYLYSENDQVVSEKGLESDLNTLLEYYAKTVSIPQISSQPEYSQGIFYMEKQLEDFIIENWERTDFGKKYDLIIEDGELVSQQYKTDIGPIDILAKDKKNNNFVVIELKKNQTSDDTIGQIARYMGWIRDKMGDNNVRGIIIAGAYDKKLDYALKMMSNVEVFLYEVDFKLREFKGLK